MNDNYEVYRLSNILLKLILLNFLMRNINEINK
jgi:hypothetical protein